MPHVKRPAADARLQRDAAICPPRSVPARSDPNGPWVGFGTQTEEWRKKNGEDFAKVRTASGFAVHDLAFDMLKAINPYLGLLGAGRR